MGLFRPIMLRLLEDGGDFGSEHRPLVRGDPERAVERRDRVAVEPHERVHPVRIERDEAALRPQDSEHLAGAARRIGKMVDHAAQQHAVEARVRERQALDIPLQEFYAGMLAPADLDELAADVEAGDLVACAAQEMRKSAGTAAEIDDSRTDA